jgi:hypothetical protein
MEKLKHLVQMLCHVTSGVEREYWSGYLKGLQCRNYGGTLTQDQLYDKAFAKGYRDGLVLKSKFN